MSDAAAAARAEREKPGRIAQTVRRAALRLSKMDHEAMVAAFLGHNPDPSSDPVFAYLGALSRMPRGALGSI